MLQLAFSWIIHFPNVKMVKSGGAVFFVAKHLFGLSFPRVVSLKFAAFFLFPSPIRIYSAISRLGGTPLPDTRTLSRPFGCCPLLTTFFF